MAGACLRPVLTCQGTPEIAEHRRQLPMLIDICVVQCCRLASQRHEIMKRIEYLRPGRIAAWVAGNDLVTGHDIDVLDITLHRYGCESIGARHAVGIAIEAHRLVLVHFGRLMNAWIKRTRRQRQGRVPLPVETLADSLLLSGLGAVPVTQTTTAEMGVEFGEVARPGHRRGPVAL
jgi:hypothetical protein